MNNKPFAERLDEFANACYLESEENGPPPDELKAALVAEHEALLAKIRRLQLRAGLFGSGNVTIGE